MGKAIAFYAALLLICCVVSPLGEECEIRYEESFHQLPLSEALAVYTESDPEKFGVGELTRYYVFASFINRSEKQVCLLNVRITWYNAEDEVISTSLWSWDKDLACALLPEQAVPLAVEWTSNTFPGKLDHYQLTYKARCCEQLSESEDGPIYVNNVRFFQEPGHELCVTGMVTNKGTKPITDYTLFITLYDPHEEIVGVGVFARWEVTAGFPLEAGETEPFQVTFDEFGFSGYLVSREVANFQVVAYPGRGWVPVGW